MDDLKRLEKLEKRVSELEQEVAILKQEKVFNTKKENIVEVKQLPIQKEEEIQEEHDHYKPSEPFNWSVIERVWLPRIFIFVLLLGVVWGFKVAVDEGFINEPVRILLGFIFSGVLVYFGEKNISHSRNSLGQVLLGGSVVLLMLTTFAMHNLYGMIPSFVAFWLNVIWIIGGIYFSHRHRSEALAITAALGGYLVPFLIGSQYDATLLFVSYSVLFYISLLYFSLKQSFTVLYYVAASLLHVIFLAFMAISPDANYEVLAIGILIQHIFLLVNLFLNNFKTTGQLPTIFTSFVITATWLYGSFEQTTYVIFLVWFTIVYFIASNFLWSKNRQSTPVTLSIALFSLSLVLLELLNGKVEAIILLLQGTISIYLGFKLKSIFNKVTGSIIYSFTALLILFEGIDKLISVDTLVWIVLLVSLGFIYNLVKPSNKGLSSFIFFTEAFFILAFITNISLVLTDGLDYNIQYMAVSFSWILYSIVGIIYGVSKENKNVRVIGVILIIITLLKLIFIDLPNVSLAVRAILFIGLGGIGLFISRVFYNKK